MNGRVKSPCNVGKARSFHQEPGDTKGLFQWCEEASIWCRMAVGNQAKYPGISRCHRWSPHSLSLPSISVLLPDGLGHCHRIVNMCVIRSAYGWSQVFGNVAQNPSTIVVTSICRTAHSVSRIWFDCTLVSAVFWCCVIDNTDKENFMVSKRLLQSSMTVLPHFQFCTQGIFPRTPVRIGSIPFPVQSS